MGRKRKSSKRQKQGLRGTQRPKKKTASPIGSRTIVEPKNDASKEQESWYTELWDSSRSGSRASRGFHFQDAVGAWFASRLASGNLAFDRLVPEGFDDLQLEGKKPLQIEVKSRQGRLGPFPVGAAANHIVNAWFRHVDRFSSKRSLIVVLEQGLVGWENESEDPFTEIPITHLIEEVIGLGNALSSRICSGGGPTSVLEDLKGNVTLLTCSWIDVIAETERQLGKVVQLPPGGLRVIGRELLSLVADAIDANAEADFEDRFGLDRTLLIEKINSLAELIDLDTLEFALTEGICSLVDRNPANSGDAYFEGISTQPSHVSAGLVVPLPDLISEVIAGLETSQSVLLIGPSGVGKSAAMWTLPFALQGVLWFRVNRLSDSDVPQVVRLVRAHRASLKTPVGLLVDAAGSYELEGWSRLRQAVAAVPGVLLVGTARIEDLYTLGQLADCKTVRVALHEETAMAIHAGLMRRSATPVMYWKEAFEKSNGLTLEFTHILTKGKRLNEVLRDQIADRVRGGRDLELSVLALVATANRFTASVPADKLAIATGAQSTELQTALTRLVEEHFLVERHGVYVGLHQIRSRGIVEEIHRIPPPTLEASVVSVLTILEGSALSRFVYGILSEEPQLEAPVLQALSGMVRDDVQRLIASLRGLEMVDFYRQALAWAEIAERHSVPVAFRPQVMQFAILDIDFGDFYPLPLRNAIAKMAELPDQSAIRDLLLRAVGLEEIASNLASAIDTDACLHFLRTIRQTTIDWKPLLVALQPDAPLVGALQCCTLPALGECISSARGISLDLARAFVDAIGGTEVVFKRIRDWNPWIQRVEIVSVESELVGVARFLYVSESEQGDARERAVEIGRQLLRTLPDIEKVDVKALGTGGSPLEINGFDHVASGLLRQYDYHSGAVAWNLDRVRLAQTLYGTSETERLTESAGLLKEVADLVREFGNVFVRQRIQSNDSRELLERCTSLNAKGRNIHPPFAASPLSDEGGILKLDPLSAIVGDVCGNVLPRLTKQEGLKAISAYIRSTVLGERVPAVRGQPWRLLGYEDAPLALTELASGLSDIDVVITEISANAYSRVRIASCARSGSAEESLAHAAAWARQQTQKRVQIRRNAVASALRSTGLNFDIFWVDGEPLKGVSANFAVTAAVETLGDWPAVSDQLTLKLQNLRLSGETPLLVPLLKDRSVLPLTMRLYSQRWLQCDFGEFEHLLPHPLEQGLTSPFITAFKAMEVCSGLSILRDKDGYHDQIAQFLEYTVNDFRKSITTIRNLGRDGCIEGLVDLLNGIREQVKKEWTGEINAATFAAGLERVVLGDETEGENIFFLALLISLQWDSDPISAVALFESLLG